MPAFKIIILDEADSMTNDAQAALRRTMETYTKMTRFCLVCNYVSRIIEPLASRCAKFRFKPLDPSSMQSRLRTIASSEQVNCSDDTIETLAELSEGDLRKAIMYMQSASRLCRDEEVTADIFNDIAGVVPADVVDGMFAAWVSKDVKVIQEKVNAMIRNGYSAGQLVNQLHDRVLADVTLSSRQKALMCQSIAKMDKALVDGADEQLQLLSTMLSDF